MDISANVLAVCPHFHLLHAIFGTLPSSRLPFQFSSNNSVDKDEYETFDGKSESVHYYDDTDNSDMSIGRNQSGEFQPGDQGAIDFDGTAGSSRLMENNQTLDESLIPRISMNVAEPKHSVTRRFQNRYPHENDTAAHRQQPTADTDPTARERFEFDKEIRLKELELKKYAIDADNRIRIMQLEKEERMETLRIQMEQNVQMLRIEKSGCGEADVNNI